MGQDVLRILTQCANGCLQLIRWQQPGARWLRRQALNVRRIEGVWPLLPAQMAAFQAHPSNPLIP